MYYYIFDIRQCKNKAHGEKIKDYLAELGIGGEYVYPSQARTAKELVGDALARDFSTIVAIGNDGLISDVASELVGNKSAFGIIPLNASQSIVDLVNGDDWHRAAQNLRYRKIKEIKLGEFENGQFFLTNTYLLANHPVNITLEFDNFIAQSRVKKFIISNINPGEEKEDWDLLDIFMISEEENSGSIISKLTNMISTKVKDKRIFESYFKAQRFRVFSHKNLNFCVGKQIVATTPQLIKTSRENLRLIISRDLHSTK